MLTTGSVSVLIMRTVCFSVGTECFSVNNGNSVFQCEQWEQSVSVFTVGTECFSVNNWNRVFQCEQWEQSVF